MRKTCFWGLPLSNRYLGSPDWRIDLGEIKFCKVLLLLVVGKGSEESFGPSKGQRL